MQKNSFMRNRFQNNWYMSCPLYEFFERHMVDQKQESIMRERRMQAKRDIMDVLDDLMDDRILEMKARDKIDLSPFDLQKNDTFQDSVDYQD